MKRLIGLIFFITALIPTLYGQKVETQYLSGYGKDDTVTWDFYCTGGRNSGHWTTIQVPSQWEQQGFGHYNYGRDYRTYGDGFQFADEKGMYKYDFNVPEQWKNSHVFIVFDGSMTDTKVEINGQQAGPVHQGSFYRFRYDITDKLHFGAKNQLKATVSKMSTNASVNHAERYADYWIFGGIFRPVFLEAYPKEYVKRTAIDAKANGSFAMQVFPGNLNGRRQLQAEIMDSTGQIVGRASTTAEKSDSLVTLKTNVSQPNQWTSETPYLYNVRLTVKNGNQTVYETTEKFGFRTIKIHPGDGIYVNDKKIKLKGINRHSFWPETGRTLSDAINLQDVKLIKKMNMNAVRMSHYPPDERFLELCDSLGLYVLDELAGWHDAYDTEVGSKLVREMVTRDVNHPSILFWDNGNEGGTNPRLDDDFGKYDPSDRPVLHPHHRPGHAFNHIDTNHYESYYSMKHILQDSLIYMPTEFLHSEEDGGGAAGLQDYWNLMWNAEKSAGGFIWALLDEGVVRTDYNGVIDVDRVNAPDGVLGPHREKEGSFWAMREIFSPVIIHKKQLDDNFNGTLPIENRYFFTNLDQTSYKWELVNYYDPQDWQRGHEVEKQGTIKGPDIAPEGKGNLSLNLPDDWKQYDALLLTATNAHSKKIMNWSWQIKNNSSIIDDFMSKSSGSNVIVKDRDSTVVMDSDAISVVFSKKTGRLVYIHNKHGLDPSFRNGPVLINGESKLQSINFRKKGNSAYVQAQYEGNLHQLKWTLHANGWLQMDYEYEQHGDFPFIGVSFDYPESRVMGAKWLGNGPYRVWKNRMAGGSIDVWSNKYNDTQTGHAPWQYPEFKGYFSDVSWMQLDTAEGNVLMASEDPDLFVRLFDFYGITGPTSYPELPKGDISFLDGIPPIGSKLATNIDSTPDDLGPQSEPNHVDSTFKHTLYFHFGLLK